MSICKNAFAFVALAGMAGHPHTSESADSAAHTAQPDIAFTAKDFGNTAEYMIKGPNFTCWLQGEGTHPAVRNKPDFLNCAFDEGADHAAIKPETLPLYFGLTFKVERSPTDACFVATNTAGNDRKCLPL